jgi:hypothetical protein
VKPKLEALYQIAVENVTRSAARHAMRHGQDAVVPDYAVGYKVLSDNTTTNKGESPSLKRRYTGSFTVVECRPAFHFRLQRFDTGRTLRRLAHADRLRPYRELDIDYRPSSGQQVKLVAEGFVGQSGMRWRITIGDPLAMNADMLVHAVD